ncbi:UDP-glucose/GDP-mannose dehydrogenase family protein [Candidatus Woesearchaeota archaeon]|nr:UDP-glucose/GDP-mannose dehydrogenase family protein [Candidatus Woesearchaeota archaeon]
MKIAIVGCGYVGLVSGTCIANLGNDVICVDINPEIIEKLNSGIIPIYEPGLSELVKENIKAKRLKFTLNLKEAVENSEIIFLAVNTPQSDNGEANLTSIFKAAEEVGKYINTDNKIIACKSTVPPNTGTKIEEIIKNKTNKKFYVASVPEFLAEGRAIEDFQKPERIVLGCNEFYSEEKLKELFEPYGRKDLNKIIVMSRVTSELTKYAANSMLASRVSMMNEISAIADIYGADITKIREGIGSDKRIGKEFLFPGPGFGGSCFPKDVSALAYTGSSINPVMLQAVLERNILQKQVPFNKLKNLLGPITGKTITVLGLSFKANTDDVRESPSIDLVKRLISHGTIINVYDPQGMPNFKKILSDDSIKYTESIYDAIEGSHAIILMTEWNQFRNPDFEKIFKLMKDPKVIIDSRNLWNPERMRKIGFKYDSIGRP